jgi:C4-type Zn-finger protein
MNMAKCPSCNHEIDNLIAKTTSITGFAVRGGKPLYDHDLLDDFWHTHGDKEEHWSCPICGVNLFSTEYDAVEFFKEGIAGES